MRPIGLESIGMSLHSALRPRERGAAAGSGAGAGTGVGARAAAPAPVDAQLRRLVDDHFDFIWRALRRLGIPPKDLDDCAQQVFWVAAQKLAAIEPGKEKAFLYGTAVRVAADARKSRTRRREVALDDDIGEQRDPGLDPEELAAQRSARALLDEVLDALPMDLRAIFVLFELEEMPTSEIAEVLELPCGTVASRLRRAREEFQHILVRMRARGALGGGKR
ncbi:RNA polymerase sigma factor [Sorangium sp. So ce1128]